MELELWTNTHLWMAHCHSQGLLYLLYASWPLHEVSTIIVISPGFEGAAQSHMASKRSGNRWAGSCASAPVLGFTVQLPKQQAVFFPPISGWTPAGAGGQVSAEKQTTQALHGGRLGLMLPSHLHCDLFGIAILSPRMWSGCLGCAPTQCRTNLSRIPPKHGLKPKWLF